MTDQPQATILGYQPSPPRRSFFARFVFPITLLIYTGLFLGLCTPTLFLKHKKGSVYPDFSTAGHNWRIGDSLYNRGKDNEFRYSPLVAAFFVPFDLLPDRVGEFLWRSLNFFLFVGGLYYCCRSGVPVAFTSKQICVVFLLCIPLAVGSLNNAQSNPLVLGLLLFAAGAVIRKNWALCCIAITIATCFKLYPIAFAMLLILIYPKKLSWRMFVALTAATVLPLVMQRANYVVDQYSRWVHYLSTEDRQRGPITDWYRDFRAVWHIYIAPMRQTTYQIVEVIAAALIALSCLFGRFRHVDRPLLVGYTFSLAVCWMTVLGPATESPTYILLAPALAFALVMADSKSRPLRIAYGVVLALFIAAQIGLNAGAKGRFFRDHLQPLPIAGLILMATVWIEMFRAMRATSVPSSAVSSDMSPA